MNINISVAKPMWKLGSYEEALVIIVISHVLGGEDPGGGLAWLASHSFFRKSFFDFLSFNFSKKSIPPFHKVKSCLLLIFRVLFKRYRRL